MEIEEMRIEWISDNGIWKVVGWEKPHPFQSNLTTRSINILKREGVRHEMYPLGIGANRRNLPKYVLEKYNQIHDEIRGR